MTFSIVARDPRTGAFGVATATAGPMVGVLVPHARSGVGAVATQAMTNPYLGLDVLDGLGQGAAASLEAALALDGERERRQVVVVDARGGTAGWTGGRCEPFAAHHLGDGVAVAGNILSGPEVLEAMLAAYNEAEDTGLGKRLLAALTAGASAGGDRRGVGSAALKVFETEAYATIDLRVDWAEDPMAELTQLFGMATTGDYAEFITMVPRRPVNSSPSS